MKPKFYNHEASDTGIRFLIHIDGGDLYYRSYMAFPVYIMENRVGNLSEENYQSSMYLSEYTGEWYWDVAFTEPMRQFVLAHHAMIS